jgi:hypothetical protein
MPNTTKWLDATIRRLEPDRSGALMSTWFALD